MMDACILPNRVRPPRQYDEVCILLESQRQIVNDLRKLAADFYAFSLPTLTICEGTLQVDRDDPVPPSLRELLESESRTLAELQIEQRDSGQLMSDARRVE